MRRLPLALPIAALALLATGCSKAPESNAATVNADALADELEARADNLEMLADNSTSSEAGVALENASDALDQQSANVRAAANPGETMK